MQALVKLALVYMSVYSGPTGGRIVNRASVTFVFSCDPDSTTIEQQEPQQFEEHLQPLLLVLTQLSTWLCPLEGSSHLFLVSCLLS